MEREQMQAMWEKMAPSLDERQRRLYAATLAEAYGRGGCTVAHEVTGLAQNTITAGRKDLAGKSGGMGGRCSRRGRMSGDSRSKLPANSRSGCPQGM
jgi:hypothetical protein